MKVVKWREPLRAVTMAKVVASGQQSNDTGILIRLLRSDLPFSTPQNVGDAAVTGSGHHWTSLAALSLYGCGLSVSVAYSLMELSLLWYLCYQVSFVNLLPSSFRNWRRELVILFVLCYILRKILDKSWKFPFGNINACSWISRDQTQNFRNERI